MSDTTKHEGLAVTTEGRLTSESMAALIVDALVDAGLVKKADFDKAVGIATEEIDARKAVRDY